MERNRPTVADAGEDAVLEALMQVIVPHNAAVARQHGQSLVLGPGNDDAAVLAFAAGGYHAPVVMTTDTMSEDQDFRRRWWLGPESLGAAEHEPAQEWPLDVGTKAAAQNLSDINAMGATPAALLVSLTLPGDLPLDWVEGFFRGVVRACRAEGAERCVIAGGDLGSGDTISVTITALGQVQERQAQSAQVLRRSGARPGDVLAVAGPLGRAAAGFALLEQTSAEEHAAMPLNPAQEKLWSRHAELIRDCLTAQRRPQPPLTAGPAALAAGATAGMDVSDGLLRDAARLASASGVVLTLDDEVLGAEAALLEPVAAFLGHTPQAARDWVYAGGEEYALLAAFPSGTALPEGFRRIGEVREARDGAPRVITGHAVSKSGWSSL